MIEKTKKLVAQYVDYLKNFKKKLEGVGDYAYLEYCPENGMEVICGKKGKFTHIRILETGGFDREVRDKLLSFEDYFFSLIDSRINKVAKITTLIDALIERAPELEHTFRQIDDNTTPIEHYRLFGLKDYSTKEMATALIDNAYIWGDEWEEQQGFTQRMEEFVQEMEELAYNRKSELIPLATYINEPIASTVGIDPKAAAEYVIKGYNRAGARQQARVDMAVGQLSQFKEDLLTIGEPQKAIPTPDGMSVIGSEGRASFNLRSASITAQKIGMEAIVLICDGASMGEVQTYLEEKIEEIKSNPNVVV